MLTSALPRALKGGAAASTPVGGVGGAGAPGGAAGGGEGGAVAEGGGGEGGVSLLKGRALANQVRACVLLCEPTSFVCAFAFESWPHLNSNSNRLSRLNGGDLVQSCWRIRLRWGRAATVVYLGSADRVRLNRADGCVIRSDNRKRKT